MIFILLILLAGNASAEIRCVKMDSNGSPIEWVEFNPKGWVKRIEELERRVQVLEGKPIPCHGKKSEEWVSGCVPTTESIQELENPKINR